MGIKIKLIALLLGIIYMLVILTTIKKNNLRPSYAFLWFIMAGFLISISLFEPLYQWISYSIIGIKDARHLIYIVLIGFLLVYTYFLTTKINSINDQVQQLISFVAILEKKLRDMESKYGKQDSKNERYEENKNKHEDD